MTLPGTSKAVKHGAFIALVFAHRINASINYNIWACNDMLNGPAGLIGASGMIQTYSQSFDAANPPKDVDSCKWHQASSGMDMKLPGGSWTVSTGPSGEFLFYHQTGSEAWDNASGGSQFGTLTIYDTKGQFRSKEVKCKKGPGSYAGGFSEDVWNNVWNDSVCHNCMMWQTRKKPLHCYTASTCSKLVQCEYGPFTGSSTTKPPSSNGDVSASSLVTSGGTLNFLDIEGIRNYGLLGALLPQNKSAFEAYYPKDKISSWFGTQNPTGYDQIEQGMVTVATQTAHYTKNGFPGLEALPKSIQSFAGNSASSYERILTMIKNLKDDQDIPESTANQILPILKDVQSAAIALNKSSGAAFDGLTAYQTETSSAVNGLKHAITILEDPNNNGRRKARRDALTDIFNQIYKRSMQAAIANIGHFCEMIVAGLQVCLDNMSLVNNVLSRTIASLEGQEHAMDYSKGAVSISTGALREQITIAQKEWQMVASAKIGTQ